LRCLYDVAQYAERLQHRTLLTSVAISDQWFAETSDLNDPTPSFTVNADSAVPSDLTVNYSVTAGSATAGTDYTLTSGSVVIPAGESAAEIFPTIHDDSENETQETFTVQINSVSYDDIAEGSGTATGFIDDDDSQYQVSISDQWFAETSDPNVPTPSFTVNADSSVPSDLTVNYSVTAGSATAGTDYTLTSGSVVIPAGESAAEIVPTIHDDTDNEPQETFTVQIDSVSYGQIMSGTGAATGYIDDDDSQFQVSINDQWFSEGSGSTTFQVNVDSTVPNDLTVNYSVTSGSATVNSTLPVPAGTDVIMSSGSIVITADASWADIPLTVLPDSQSEGTEAFSVQITSVSYGVIAQATATGFVDNDDTVYGISVTDMSYNESDGACDFFIDSDSPVPLDLTVTYTVMSGSATLGTDFNMSSGTATISAWDSSTSVPITIVNDGEREGPENFTVQITSVSYGSIVSGSATGEIIDDEPTAVAVGGSEVDTNDDGVPDTYVKDTYEVDYRGTLTLDGTGSSDPNGDPLIYRWDLDGNTSTWEKSGATPQVTWTELTNNYSHNAGDTFTVTLEVDDGNGGTDRDTASVHLFWPVIAISSNDTSAAEGHAEDLTIPGAYEVTTELASFTISRTNTALDQSLNVVLIDSGTATNGVDYTLDPTVNPTAISVRIEAGQTSVTVTLNPAEDDDFLEATETATFTLWDSPTYDLGTATAVTLEITDVNREPVIIGDTIHIPYGFTGPVRQVIIDPDAGQTLTVTDTEYETAPPNTSTSFFNIDSNGILEVTGTLPTDLSSSRSYTIDVSSAIDNGTLPKMTSGQIEVVVHDFKVALTHL
jgi:hypothetical protein